MIGAGEVWLSWFNRYPVPSLTPRLVGMMRLLLLYTSGTTGKSKGALLTHGNLASNALTLAEAWGFGPRDVLIHALPIYHTHGLFTATNTVLFSGGSLLFRRKFEVDEVISLFPQATSLMGVPTFYTTTFEP